jgi:Domain of unknown function (DUF5655)
VNVRTVEGYFEGKPHSEAVFRILHDLVLEQGDCTVEVATQITYKVRRKFAWIWLYNVTRAHPEGTVQILLALGREAAEPPVYRVSRIGEHRWNHLVVVHHEDEARDPRLRALVADAYRYGCG